MSILPAADEHPSISGHDAADDDEEDPAGGNEFPGREHDCGHTRQDLREEPSRPSPQERHLHGPRRAAAAAEAVAAAVVATAGTPVAAAANSAIISAVLRAAATATVAARFVAVGKAAEDFLLEGRADIPHESGVGLAPLRALRRVEEAPKLHCQLPWTSDGSMVGCSLFGASALQSIEHTMMS